MPNSSVLLTPGWTFGQPTVSGVCGSTPQALTRSIPNNNPLRTTLINPLTATAYATGLFPPLSDDVRITYRTVVQSSVFNGTTLTNGASVSTPTTEDLIYPNLSSQNVQVPFPDPYVTISADAIVMPDDEFETTISYGNTARTCTKT